MLSIGTLAKCTGTKVQTIRYYEQIGLLPEPGRTEGGQRRYSEGDLDRLAFIRHARLLGFTLDAIRELLDLSDNPARSCAEVARGASSRRSRLGSPGSRRCAPSSGACCRSAAATPSPIAGCWRSFGTMAIASRSMRHAAEGPVVLIDPAGRGARNRLPGVVASRVPAGALPAVELVVLSRRRSGGFSHRPRASARSGRR